MAFLVDLLLGDPKKFPHPVRIIGKYITNFERQVRCRRLGPTGLRIAGIFLTITAVGATYLAVWGLLTG
jgi:adenosylcobinamide-phosphate synthase